MNTDSPLLCQREGPVLTLTFNRPEARNALNQALIARLTAELEAAQDDPDLRVVVLRGAGPCFSAGVDLKERRAATVAQRQQQRRRLHHMIHLVELLPVPVVAALHGPVLGAGVELAAACDLRVASSDAVLGFSEAALAVFPGAGGPVRLQRLMSLGMVKLMVFTGRRLSAEEARACGLVELVVPPDRLDACLAELTADISRGTREGLKAAKILMQRSAEMGLEAAMDLSVALRQPLDGSAAYEQRLDRF
ncbi:MAG TPA: enoyl-CoA hydratase/isomerase family protein [Bacillota bacterium]